MFQTRKISSGLKAARIVEAIVKLIRIANSDWRNVRIESQQRRKHAIDQRVAERVVSRMISGNLMATYNACSGARQSPIAAP